MMPTLSFSTGSTTTIDDTWTSWTTIGTSSTANSATYSLSDNGTAAWTNWVLTYANGTTNVITHAYPYQARVIKPPTPEELAAEQARIDESNRQWKARQEAEKLANARADALLAEFLDAMQADQYGKEAAFIVETDSGKRYELKRGKRVAELGPDGKAVAMYCIHLHDSNIPQPDVLLSQKLMLETDEACFLRTANRTAVR